LVAFNPERLPRRAVREFPEISNKMHLRPGGTLLDNEPFSANHGKISIIAGNHNLRAVRQGEIFQTSSPNHTPGEVSQDVRVSDKGLEFHGVF
jgi:hypothetical protein